LIVAAVVVAVVVGIAAIGLLVGDSTGNSAAVQLESPKPTPSSPPPAGHTITSPVNTPPPATTPSNLPALNCSNPPPLPAKPQQFPKPPSKSLAENATWRATIETNCGPIVIDLDGKAAPQTVSSFIFLAQKNFFDDVPCHRLTTSGLYVLQCGDPTGSGSGGPGYGYGIENAPADGDYPSGTVAMARTADPNSNGSQFFIVYDDTILPTDGGGYSIFGKVVEGLDIVQAIAAQGLAPDGTAPKQPVSMLDISVEKL
jgi:peptidyl-prolyl cis-trans isomerase B (cyclophilin B)